MRNSIITMQSQLAPPSPSPSLSPSPILPPEQPSECRNIAPASPHSSANTPDDLPPLDVHPDDKKDKVFTAIMKALQLLHNKPSSPKELANVIMKYRFATLGGATPYATVSSRISQHFKRSAETRRKPVLARHVDERSARRFSYSLDIEGLRGHQQQSPQHTNQPLTAPSTPEISTNPSTSKRREVQQSPPPPPSQSPFPIRKSARKPSQPPERLQSFTLSDVSPRSSESEDDTITDVEPSLPLTSKSRSMAKRKRGYSGVKGESKRARVGKRAHQSRRRGGKVPAERRRLNFSEAEQEADDEHYGDEETSTDEETTEFLIRDPLRSLAGNSRTPKISDTLSFATYSSSSSFISGTSNSTNTDLSLIGSQVNTPISPPMLEDEGGEESEADYSDYHEEMMRGDLDMGDDAPIVLKPKPISTKKSEPKLSSPSSLAPPVVLEKKSPAFPPSSPHQRRESASSNTEELWLPYSFQDEQDFDTVFLSNDALQHHVPLNITAPEDISISELDSYFNTGNSPKRNAGNGEISPRVRRVPSPVINKSSSPLQRQLFAKIGEEVGRKVDESRQGKACLGSDPMEVKKMSEEIVAEIVPPSKLESEPQSLLLEEQGKLGDNVSVKNPESVVVDSKVQQEDSELMATDYNGIIEKEDSDLEMAQVDNVHKENEENGDEILSISEPVNLHPISELPLPSSKPPVSYSIRERTLANNMRVYEFSSADGNTKILRFIENLDATPPSLAKRTRRGDVTARGGATMFTHHSYLDEGYVNATQLRKAANDTLGKGQFDPKYEHSLAVVLSTGPKETRGAWVPLERARELVKLFQINRLEGMKEFLGKVVDVTEVKDGENEVRKKEEPTNKNDNENEDRQNTNISSATLIPEPKLDSKVTSTDISISTNKISSMSQDTIIKNQTENQNGKSDSDSSPLSELSDDDAFLCYEDEDEGFGSDDGRHGKIQTPLSTAPLESSTSTLKTLLKVNEVPLTANTKVIDNIVILSDPAFSSLGAAAEIVTRRPSSPQNTKSLAMVDSPITPATTPPTEAASLCWKPEIPRVPAMNSKLSAIIDTVAPTIPPMHIAVIDQIPVYVATLSQSAGFRQESRLMRRVDTDYVNGMTLLMAGGIETDAERSIVLSLEVGRIRIRKQGSEFQGTWIPLRRAQALASTCSLLQRLGPFLSEDLNSYFPSPLPIEITHTAKKKAFRMDAAGCGSNEYLQQLLSTHPQRHFRVGAQMKAPMLGVFESYDDLKREISVVGNSTSLLSLLKSPSKVCPITSECPSTAVQLPSAHLSSTVKAVPNESGEGKPKRRSHKRDLNSDTDSDDDVREVRERLKVQRQRLVDGEDDKNEEVVDESSGGSTLTTIQLIPRASASTVVGWGDDRLEMDSNENDEMQEDEEALRELVHQGLEAIELRARSKRKKIGKRCTGIEDGEEEIDIGGSDMDDDLR